MRAVLCRCSCRLLSSSWWPMSEDGVLSKHLKVYAHPKVRNTCTNLVPHSRRGLVTFGKTARNTLSAEWVAFSVTAQSSGTISAVEGSTQSLLNVRYYSPVVVVSSVCFYRLPNQQHVDAKATPHVTYGGAAKPSPLAACTCIDSAFMMKTVQTEEISWRPRCTKGG